MPNILTVPANSPILFQQSLKQLMQPADLYKYVKCGFGMWLYRQGTPSATAAQVAARGAAAWNALTDVLNGSEWQNAFLNSNLSASTLLTLIGGQQQGLWSGLSSSGTILTPASALLWDVATNPNGYMFDQSALFAKPPYEFGQYLDDFLQFLADQTGGAQADVVFRDALNQFTAQQLRIAAGWPAPDSADANTSALALSGVNFPDAARNGLQPDGTIQFDVASADSEIDSQISTVQTWANTASTNAANLDAALLLDNPPGPLLAGPNAIFSAQDPNVRQSILNAAATAGATNANSAKPLAAAQTVIDTIGKLVGYADPSAGKAITTVGDAVIKIATSLQTFSSTTSSLINQLGGNGFFGGLSADTAATVGSALGSAVLTGNIVSAALSVVGLFLNQGPDPTILLLQSIQKAITQLGQQVQQLSTQMNTRFNNVDAELQSIYGSIESGFNQVISLLEGTHVQLNEIQNELVGLASQITRLSIELQAYLVGIENNDLIQMRDLVLNWRVWHLDATDVLPFEGGDPNFTAAEGEFYTWSTYTALNTPQITAPGPVDPVTLSDLLTGPVAANINLIAAALTSAGLPSFITAGETLPNMNAWSLGADYYAQLEWEWLTQYAGKISGARLVDVASAGSLLLTALTKVAELSAPPNQPVSAPVFAGVAGKYIGAVNNLLQGLELYIPTFIAGTLKPVLLHFGPTWTTTTPDIDLFGSPDQALAWLPFPGYDPAAWNFANIQVGNPTNNQQIPDPTGTLSRYILQRLPQALQTYLYLNLSSSSTPPSEFTIQAVCSWTNAQQHHGVGGFGENKGRTEWTTAQYMGTIEASWNGVVAVRWSNTSPQAYIIDSAGPDGWHPPGTVYDAPVESYFGTDFTDLWDGSMPYPSDGVPDPAFAATAAALQAATAARLLQLQAQLCTVLQQQVQNAGDLFTLGKAVTGWKLLTDNLIQLALPNQLASSDTLKGLLSGSDSIFDAAGIAAELAARAAAPELGVNLIAQLGPAASERSAYAQNVILSLLQQLEAKGAWDFPVNVYNSMLRLEAIAALRGVQGLAPHPIRPPQYAPPDPAQWYTIQDKASQAFLAYNPTAGAGANGTPVSSLPATGGDEQLWQFAPQPDGTTALLNKASGRYLDVTGASTGEGAPLQLWDFLSGADQRWFPVYDQPGALQLIAAQSGLSVQANASQAQQTTWNGLDSQRMQLTSAAVGATDLWFVKTANPASGFVEVHRRTTASGYQSGLDLATGLSPADAANGSYQIVGVDLWFIETTNSASGFVEVHERTSASGYQSGQDLATALSPGDSANGWFQMVGADLWFIKTKNTASGFVEVHQRTAASNYQSGADAATSLTTADAGNGWFQMAGGGLWFVKTNNAASGFVEVHQRSAASLYQTGLDLATNLSLADAVNGSYQMVGADLWFIQTKNTSSGAVEVHQRTAASDYQQRTILPTGLSTTDADNGRFQIGGQWT